jgi:hypothetical protein
MFDQAWMDHELVASPVAQSKTAGVGLGFLLCARVLRLLVNTGGGQVSAEASLGVGSSRDIDA